MISATLVVPRLLTNPPLRRDFLIPISRIINRGNTVFLHIISPSIENDVSALNLAPLNTRRVDRNFAIPLQCSRVIFGGEQQ